MIQNAQIDISVFAYTASYNRQQIQVILLWFIKLFHFCFLEVVTYWAPDEISKISEETQSSTLTEGSKKQTRNKCMHVEIKRKNSTIELLLKARLYVK